MRKRNLNSARWVAVSETTKEYHAIRFEIKDILRGIKLYKETLHNTRRCIYNGDDSKDLFQRKEIIKHTLTEYRNRLRKLSLKSNLLKSTIKKLLRGLV